jgi:hypothetical protein
VGDHKYYAYSMGIPALIFWGFGIPLFALGLLIYYRERLPEIYIKTKLGFIYVGYKLKTTFYWEVVITFRKLIISFIAVFLLIVSPEV